MGCAASATTKLTSVMPIDEETAKYETRKEQAKVEIEGTFVVPEVPEQLVLFELCASCLKLVSTLVLFHCFTVLRLSGLVLVMFGERAVIMSL